MPESGRKTIIYLIDSLGMGGAERLLVPIVERLDRDRFEPRVCALHVRDGNPIADDIRAVGVPVDLVPIHRLRHPSNIPRLVRYLREQRADLVHTQLEFANTLGGPAAKWLRLPAVCTLHTEYDPLWGPKSYRRHLVMWWSLRYFFDRVIGISEPTLRHNAEKGKLNPAKTLKVYNGIDLAAFAPPDAAETARLREALGIPESAPVLITVAVLRPQKGIQYMIDALPAILLALPDTRYLVVGDGAHRDTLTEHARERGVADRVIFAGQRKDIAALLALADVFVLPTMAEALPNVLAEAMAARRPIVACNAGGVPEMVDEGVNGFVLPPRDPAALADACLRLLHDPPRARQMGEAGWEIAQQRFSIAQQVRQLGDLYDSLIAANQGRSSR